MTDQELRELVASNTRSIAELRESIANTDKQVKKLSDFSDRERIKRMELEDLVRDIVTAVDVLIQESRAQNQRINRLEDA